jgi:xanthine dehydrogenase accessory factor
LHLFVEIARLSEAGTRFVLATVVESQGSTPQKAGSRLLVLDDGSTVGTIGGGAVEQQVVEAARALLADPTGTTRLLDTHLTHDLGMCCGGRMRVFLERHGAAPRLFIFGAGHVSKELAALAHGCGFQVTVVDARPEWANAQRFPNVALRLEDPADAARALEGGADCYACVTTHDHPLDQACVEALLKKPFAYLGVIGSRRKAERFKQRLLAAGFDLGQLERLHCPMGVPIAALTPVEIAVSIVGQLISVRRKTTPR